MYTWSQLQDEVTVWVKKNFPESPAQHPVMGLLEELGELTHTQLKKEQGIRGSVEKHIAAGKDAIADSVIFFMDVCTRRGWDVEETLGIVHSEPEVGTLAYFQRAWSGGLFPLNRKPITYILMHLARFTERLEDAEFEPLKKEAHIADAKWSAQHYMGGLAGYCTLMGWDFAEIVEETWCKVQQRDWTKNKVTGGDVDMSRGQAQKDLEDAEDAQLRAILDLGGGVRAVAMPVDTEAGPAFKLTATEPLLK